MSRLTWTFLVVGAATVLIAGALLLMPQRGRAGASVVAARPVAAAEPAGSPAAAPQGQRVTIDNFSFEPQVLTVAPGTRVTWLNRDDVPHTATSSESPPKFNSKAIDTDGQFSFVFTQPGSYPYFCAVHPKMTATIIVK